MGLWLIPSKNLVESFSIHMKNECLNPTKSISKSCIFYYRTSFDCNQLKLDFKANKQQSHGSIQRIHFVGTPFRSELSARYVFVCTICVVCVCKPGEAAKLTTICEYVHLCTFKSYYTIWFYPLDAPFHNVNQLKHCIVEHCDIFTKDSDLRKLLDKKRNELAQFII